MSPLALSQQYFKRANVQRAVTMAQILRMKLRYDAAQTNASNRKHWAMADGLAADAANSPEVRKIIRERSRYECACNSYAAGIVETLANDTVGTGPRLQIRGFTSAVCREIESLFNDWARAQDLKNLLRVMRKSKAVSGEVFAIRTSFSGLRSQIKMFVKVIEADQCHTPTLDFTQEVDGIELNSLGLPEKYHFLKRHPGSSVYSPVNDFDVVPASIVYHYFRQDRPQQHRGIPETTPALPLFAMLRRYTLAVLDAAETAANHSMFIKTGAPANVAAEDVENDAWAEFDIQRNMVTALPHGYEPFQMKAEQPTTTYKEFKAEILNEIARCLNMPFNIAACNSSGYNYSSGRLDHQTYYKSIDVERREIQSAILDPIFMDWIKQAIRFLSIEARAALETVNNRPNVQWFWDGMKHVDPAKEATAEATRLQSNTTTLAQVYAEQGLDWEEQLEQRGRELARMKQLGITPDLAAADNKAPVEESESEAEDE